MSKFDPKSQAKEYVADLIEQSRKAQKIAEGYDQAMVDKLCAAIAWATVKADVAEELAQLCLEETKMGNIDGKRGKLRIRPRGAWRDMKGQKSVGLIEHDMAKGIMKYAKPIGVIGAIAPVTNPEVTPIVKAMSAIKGRNSVIVAPHPRSKKINAKTCDYMRAALKANGAPEDLIMYIAEPTMESTQELMKQADLVLATGGAGLVKEAYQSGRPALGVGAGNAVVIIDESADLDDATSKVVRSKIFDWATSCSADNNLIIVDKFYDEAMKQLVEKGGYIATPAEKEALRKVMFTDYGRLDAKANLAAVSAHAMAEKAGWKLPEGKTFIMLESKFGEAGAKEPFSGEKLSPTLNVYKYPLGKFKEAVAFLNEIHEWSGKGHSCCIHSNNQENINYLVDNTYTSRVMVRLPTSASNSGNWFLGMPFTLSLGCGTWGGNSVSENITWKNLINTTWVAHPLPERVPSDLELFGEEIMKANP